jgi:hypothetical protein
MLRVLLVSSLFLSGLHCAPAPLSPVNDQINLSNPVDSTGVGFVGELDTIAAWQDCTFPKGFVRVSDSAAQR